MSIPDFIVSVVYCRGALFMVATLCLCGCAAVGPQSITAGRGVYTEVINRTEDQQILNVLVRMRYDETFGMISVVSVTANLSFSAQAVTDIGIGDSSNYAGNLVPLSAGIAYEENPTISYVPLNGEEFMRRMITPISLSEWILIAGPVKRKGMVFDLAVQRINGLRNPRPGEESPSPEFARIVALYDRLRRAAVLDIVTIPETGKEYNYFWGIHDYEDSHSDSVREFLDLLGINIKLDGSPIVLPLREAIGSSTSAIHVKTRSPYDVLRGFGVGIEIPSAHLEAGIVEPLTSAVSEERKIMRIRSSENPPSDATVQIRFRDRWFYVESTDTWSKRAFGFLRTFIAMRLAASGAAQQAPILTVPVN